VAIFRRLFLECDLDSTLLLFLEEDSAIYRFLECLIEELSHDL
jgi:hypothetical protein